MALVAHPAVADVNEVTNVDQASVSGPDKTYSWDMGSSAQPVTVRLPDERTGRLQTIRQLAPAALMLLAIALGLTITFTSLRSDMRQRRRVVYRPRGPRSTEGGTESDTLA